MLRSYFQIIRSGIFSALSDQIGLHRSEPLETRLIFDPRTKSVEFRVTGLPEVRLLALQGTGGIPAELYTRYIREFLCSRLSSRYF